MLVRLLKADYLKSDQAYKDFLDDVILKNEDNFDEVTIFLEEAPDFPIYLYETNEELRREKYIEALTVVSNHYLKLPRDVHFDSAFWYSLLLTKKRDYIIENYPEVLKSESKFKNIVMKKFDWENYIYKCVLASQYIEDNVRKDDRVRYYALVADNMDVFNYIIKYEIFRNDKFMINVLDIIDDHQLSEVLKKKIKGREDLGDDERYGRRVIFEMNKSYPVVLAPMMSKDELEVLFLENLGKYLGDEL